MILPENWQLTLGPFIPGGGTQGKTALRIYEGKLQRACLMNVTMFRDLSIEFYEGKIDKSKTEIEWSPMGVGLRIKQVKMAS